MYIYISSLLYIPQVLILNYNINSAELWTVTVRRPVRLYDQGWISPGGGYIEKYPPLCTISTTR